MKSTMRQMVAGKLDPVEEYRRALRHAAHEYHLISSAEINDAKIKSYADALYRAARALVAAELIHGIREGK